MKKFIPFIIIIILLLIIRNIAVSITSLIKNEHTVEELSKVAEEREREHQFLTQRRYFVKTNEFTESEARQKLGLVKDNEYVVIAPPPPQEEVVEIEKELPNWEQWKELFF